MRLAGTNTDLRVSFYRGDFDRSAIGSSTGGGSTVRGRWWCRSGSFASVAWRSGTRSRCRRRGRASRCGSSVRRSTTRATRCCRTGRPWRWSRRTAGRALRDQSQAGHGPGRVRQGRAGGRLGTAGDLRSGRRQLRRDRAGNRRTADADAGDRGCARCLQHRRPQHPRTPPRSRHAQVDRHDARPGHADGCDVDDRSGRDRRPAGHPLGDPRPPLGRPRDGATAPRWQCPPSCSTSTPWRSWPC